MNRFWYKELPVGTEWFFICLAASILAIPIIRVFCVNKEDFRKLYGGLLFLLYVGGFFVVLVLLFRIGGNVIKILGLLPEEYNDVDRHMPFSGINSSSSALHVGTWSH